MRNDPMAMVDDTLRVIGIAGLRVTEASIMPTIVSANTNAPSIMIGEKCAGMITGARTGEAAHKPPALRRRHVSFWLISDSIGTHQIRPLSGGKQTSPSS